MKVEDVENVAEAALGIAGAVGAPATIIATATVAIQALKALYADYQAGKVALSETEVAQVHQNLLDAEAATAAFRPVVDAALEAASKN